MLEALTLAIRQLPSPEMRDPLLRTLAWTLGLCGILAFAAYCLLDRFAAGLGDYGPILMIAGVASIAILLWFVFAIIENTVLFCYAARIVSAVERRHYPSLPASRGAGWADTLRSGLRLLGLTVLLNILALPVYFIVPGANLVLFVVLNGYLLGRGFFDAVALRRWDDRSASRIWRSERGGFVLNGMISAALLTVPVVNLVVPIIGLAAAVHLFEGRRGVAHTGARSIGAR